MSAATSSLKTKDNSGSNDESNLTYKHPYLDFCCSLCGLNEKCFYGKLSAGNGHYPQEVYYMRDPFEPLTKKSRKLMLFDFLVIGSTCHLCSRSICIHKSCSVFFGNHFCVDCLSRERRRFPEEILQMTIKAQETHFQFTAPKEEKDDKILDDNVPAK